MVAATTTLLLITGRQFLKVKYDEKYPAVNKMYR